MKLRKIPASVLDGRHRHGRDAQKKQASLSIEFLTCSPMLVTHKVSWPRSHDFMQPSALALATYSSCTYQDHPTQIA
eukprot:3327197-Amphidinium_carterae.2